ncbi:hypothetical protein PO587_36250 [Streptomyces gilvifuscus]|uniref:Uncharacterized protein n=1 Tax=Streptomyces gilvifuscus TaxID=1550617 RepID=A0ABT5G5K3_9ACTN|nr:hypothetical protein [Streptomyces gilvifuscus]MDC2959891.1 hypothetical protein [Streptomyces gilvifuscus]
MATHIANGDSRLSLWLRVREYAVPPSMIETATARRIAGDWAGACAAARVDVDLDPRSVTRAHGRELAARVRDDLRHLAPDLLRWHMPRIAPDGLLRPGLTVGLARYTAAGRDGPYTVHLVARTPPAWADAGQRIALAVWDGSRAGTAACPHPHPHPRFRMDLHRHLWDARRAGELRVRSGADRPAGTGERALPRSAPNGHRCAVDRWAAEARLVLRADERAAPGVVVRLGRRYRLLLDPLGGTPVQLRTGGDGLPVLPDAATWVPPDLELLRAGAIDAGRLHPLVAAALAPAHASAGPLRTPERGDRPHLVECRGEVHRIGLVDGVLSALDHRPDEIRREELLAALTGTPLPCLQAIDRAHRRPDCLAGVRERLDHGDTAGALAVVEGLLGREAVLRDGPLREELEAAAQRRIAYGLFRNGLAGPAPGRVLPGTPRPSSRRGRPRHGTFR